ncbi:trypsin-like [Hyposmocoma kahamanoa]|uniref:trypsin-like n=1 Tax=Hyposmocoma kahamanoa TaxID=1477025 RepID=UPI000E6D610F|nr:trypsin-like [Hyposmocoma kahamanoa]
MFRFSLALLCGSFYMNAVAKSRSGVSGKNPFGLNNNDGRRQFSSDEFNVDGLRIRNVDPLGKAALRIRGGNSTDTINFPYMAAIIINGRLWCAGAIIDQNWIVTAAHCLNYVLHVSPMKTLHKYVKVRVGSSRPHEGGQLMEVVGAVRHPKFEEEPVPHADIALLKLADNLEFNKHVNLIKIYDGSREPYAQSFVVITGWGATRGSELAFRDHTPDLLTARLKVRTQHYCMDAYQLVNGFMFTDDFFCASLRNGSRDACLFDAGAPAVQQNRLMGIMSFGPERCGHEYQPAVFIKAFYFREFVKYTISAYKSTQDLIEAMKVVDPTIRPPLLTVEQPREHQFVEFWQRDEVTEPDQKHDK